LIAGGGIRTHEGTNPAGSFFHLFIKA